MKKCIIMLVFFVAMLLLAMVTDESEYVIVDSSEVGYADTEVFIANE